ncbi:hypothetical protein ACPA54_08495 [Uniformispora flossi]|uniref:hypothetical protein n=1 Tax=Uniformispora flossi TaxID=3390723 RepID=UPI003C2D252E
MADPARPADGPEPSADAAASGTPARKPAARDRFGWDDLLPDRTSDERDATWGESRSNDAADIRRFLDEKPPHHL